MNRRLIALLLVLVLVFSLMCACGSADPADTGTKQDSASDNSAEDAAQDTSPADQAITVGIVGSGECFDRASVYGFPDCFALPLVYDSLFVIDPDTGECEPQLVDSYTWDDETHITITLKDHIYFSDGTQMTGEDVIATMYRFIETGGSQMSNFIMFDFEHCSVDANDPLTFTLAYYSVHCLGERYLSTFEILPKDWIATAEADDWYNAPVGSGPYRLVSNDGVTKVFSLREDYWDSDNLPAASEITLKYYTDQTSLFVDFMNGTLDIAYNVSSSDMEQALSGGAQENGYTAQVQADNGNILLVLCDHVEAFQDINVRKAVAHAIDIENVTLAAYGALGTPSKSTIPASFSDCVESSYAYDPELSRQLLSDAGYADGDIAFKIVCTNDAQTVNMAEAIQAYLSQVGISLDVESYDIPTAVGVWMGLGTDLMLQNKTSSLLDPYQIFEPLGNGYSNPASIVSDPTFNEYLQTGASSLDPAVRTKAYQDAQTWLSENYWVIPICDTGTGVVYNSRIASCNSISPMYYTNLRYVAFAD